MNMEEKNLAIWMELTRRGIAVRDDHTTPPRERRRLLLEILDLSMRAKAGGVPREDWENHELNWIAYVANLRHNLVHSLAEALTEAERGRVGRGRYLNNNMKRLLDWWQNEGGREELLGELPIAERHALESAKD